MRFVTMSHFRSRQSELLASVHAEPVTLTSRGVGRRAVVVSPELYDRALGPLRTGSTSSPQRRPGRADR